MSQVKTKFIADNAVTNAKLDQAPATTLKGNNTGGTANVADLTVSQVNTLLGDILANGTVPFTADQSLGSHKLTNVTDPSGAQDAATKNYVDVSLAALNPAAAVFAATTTNLVGTYSNGASGVGATFTITATGAFTVDGTTPAANSRILIKDQSSGFQNGIYDLTVAGSLGVSPVLTRSLDYNTAADMNSAGLIPIISGTVNALSSWQQVAFITTVGTDSLVFTEFTANPSLYLLKANNLSDVASKSASFDNLSPMTTGGDIIYGGASGTGTRLANGSSGQVLTSNGGTSAPSWTSPAGTGTVTSVSVVSANGLAGTVATATSTPAITLSTTITGVLKGNGTAISAATSGTDYSAGTSGLATGILKSTTGTGALTIAVAGDFPALPYASSTLTDAHIFVGNGSNVATDVAVSGDLTLADTGAFTLNTVNSNTGSFGSSTSIPSFTVNGKGLITAASGNAVIAPAGTLSGTTLNSTVVSSSLTSVGTIATGVWNGTTIAVANGGTGQTSYTDGQLLIGNTSGNTLTPATLTAGTGISITNGNGSISIASTGGATPSWNYTAQTSNYNAVANDYITCSSTSFTVTLPTASGVSGQSIAIVHAGTSLTNVYTINTTGGQNIRGPGGVNIASGVYTLVTAAETVILTSNGVGLWFVSDRIAATKFVSAGAISLSATAAFVFSWTGNQNIVQGSTYTDGSSNVFTVSTSTNTTTGTFSGPNTPATTGTLTLATGTGVSSITWTSRTTTGQPVIGTNGTNQVQWMRAGNMATVRYTLNQTAAGTAGSGDYIFYLPTGITIDTNLIPQYVLGPGTTLLNNAPSFPSFVQTSAAATNNTTSIVGLTGVSYATNSFRWTGGGGGVTNIGSSNIQLSTTTIGYNFAITFPVSGWQP